MQILIHQKIFNLFIIYTLSQNFLWEYVEVFYLPHYKCLHKLNMFSCFIIRALIRIFYNRLSLYTRSIYSVIYRFIVNFKEFFHFEDLEAMDLHKINKLSISKTL